MNPKPKILFVDDESTNLVAFKASFRKLYTVFTAEDGPEALKILEQEPGISVIITDQRMPGMTGVQLLSEAKKRFPHPIRIVLTGYSDLEAIVEAINEAQAWQYLTKPWVFRELKMVLDRAVESWQLQRENQQLHSDKTALLLLAEKQEKQQIISRFESLKNQVNPHFLFNSLNTLSNLIHEEPLLAEEFLTKLTRVYRYVLELKDDITVSLDREMSFAKHYIFLQQIRFDNALHVYWQVPDRAKILHIPPMTLQLLIENAVKHNVVSKTQPLQVELLVAEDHFIVQNNYQPRNEQIISTGLGLTNLQSRYELLGASQPVFKQEGNRFVAKVPLISQA